MSYIVLGVSYPELHSTVREFLLPIRLERKYSLYGDLNRKDKFKCYKCIFKHTNRIDKYCNICLSKEYISVISNYK